jgi:hypothetical protein
MLPDFYLKVYEVTVDTVCYIGLSDSGDVQSVDLYARWSELA